MKSYTYNQLPEHTQGIARTHMTEADKRQNTNFIHTVAAGLRKRGFPTYGIGHEHITLSHGTIYGLTGMSPGLIETFETLFDANFYFTLEETVDGHIIVRSEYTDKQMAEGAGVDIRMVTGLRRVVSQMIEQAMPEARRFFIGKFIRENGMPPLFTAKGEMITYDLHE